MTAMAIESLQFGINGLRDRPGNGWWGVVRVMNVLNMTGSNISLPPSMRFILSNNIAVHCPHYYKLVYTPAGVTPAYVGG